MIGDNVGVMPTDTIYGLCASAFSKKAVLRIYEIKGRRPDKPLIILISSLNDLRRFGIKLNKNQVKIIKRLWPGKVSVVLPCKNKNFNYLTRGTKTLAFRFPGDKKLLKILRKTGPLVAPSANPEGKKPAINIKTAKKYFGTKVDFYIDGGELKSKPSTLVLLKENSIQILRQGAVNI